jgi:hypothetical protein
MRMTMVGGPLDGRAQSIELIGRRVVCPVWDEHAYRVSNGDGTWAWAMSQAVYDVEHVSEDEAVARYSRLELP